MPGGLADDASAVPDFGDNVDMNTFSQILEMDESEDDRDFSQPLVMSFIGQVEETFGKMDVAMEKKELKTLSELGHFLKGSSAILGFNKIRDSCQIIQQYGKKLTLENTPEPDEAVCFKKIKDALKAVKKDFADLEPQLKVFFGTD